MKNLTMKKSTKANSRLAITKDLLNKIIENDDMCTSLMNSLVRGRQYIFTRISDSAFPQEEKNLRMKEEVKQTEELIRKTANYISKLHQKMEKELESLEVLGKVMNTDRMGIFKEMEEMRIEKLREIMNIYVELIITEPEIENQSNLIIEYRYMLKNINKKHMANQIMVELQNKINKDRLSGFIIQKSQISYKCNESLSPKTQSESVRKRPKNNSNLPVMSTGNNPVEAGGGVEAVRSDQHNIKNTNPDLSEKSKKDTLDLVTLENKKLKGDKQGLKLLF